MMNLRDEDMILGFILGFMTSVLLSLIIYYMW